MELTKQQIQYIDYRLENEGIKYWDILIEMLDHVVSDIENQLKPKNIKNEFNEIVTESFIALGWKENFNGGGLDHINKENFKNIAKKRREVYKKEFKLFFKNNIQVVFLLLFFVLYFLTSTLITHKQFVIVSYVIFLLPFFCFIYEGIKLWKKKLGKSFYKDQGLNSLYFSFAFFNVFMVAMKSEGQDFAIPVEYQKIVLFIILPTHLLLSIIGYKTYKKVIAEVEKMKNQLL